MKTDVLTRFRTWLEVRLDIRERHAIANLFNNRYCFRIDYISEAQYLVGSAVCGMLPRGGNAWMCPECNKIHHPVSCSVFDGLQYPSCCKTPKGGRIQYGFKSK